jgi:hypothetical protein
MAACAGQEKSISFQSSYVHEKNRLANRDGFPFYSRAALKLFFQIANLRNINQALILCEYKIL